MSNKETKDLYKLLNVSKDSTPSELKAAHREAVLKYHPDIVGSTPETLEKFRDVQEAYKVLSTPDLKSEYDLSIARQTNKIPSTTVKVATGSASANIYGIQKQNFQDNILKNASSEWSQNLPKYRLEKWKKIPLDEKKKTRIRPIWNARSLTVHYAPYLLSIGISIGLFAYYTSSEVRYGSFVKGIQSSIIFKKSEHAHH